MATFVIEGRCPTKGSTRSFVRGGKVVTIADNDRLRQWTKDAKWQARAAQVPMVYKPRPVWMQIRVEFVKPKSVKQALPTVRPDIDKLTRAVLDALTNVAYQDDSQVVSVATTKTYGPVERVTVTVGEVPVITGVTVVGYHDDQRLSEASGSTRSAAQKNSSSETEGRSRLDEPKRRRKR